VRAGEHPPRRACTSCGRPFAVRDDGTIRRHRAPYGVSALDRCAGQLGRPRSSVWQQPGCGDDCPCRLPFFRESDRTVSIFSTGTRHGYQETEPGVFRPVELAA
jgi:hypothetical protein